MAKNKITALKVAAFPFKVIGKTLYYAAKGVYYLGKGTYIAGRGTGNLIKSLNEKRKLRKMKPKNLAAYKKLEEIKILDGSLENFEKLLNTKGKIGIILGGRGTGKSAIGMRMLENIHSQTSSKVYAMGFDDKRMPSWIIPINKIVEVENNSFVLIDESGINFSSRNSMSGLNKMLSELLLIARHKNISVAFITQNSSNIEVNILRQADYLVLKPHSLLQLDFERKIIKDIYSDVSKYFEKLKEPNLAYVHSNDFRGFIKNDLPSFWSENLSKSFSGENISGKDKPS